jgi:beta-lactamase regulating signal transducer with metallopeptidase domain
VETLWQAGLSNAVSATFLALIVACLSRVLARRPAILHCLWLIVLVKLVIPPMVHVPLPWSDPFLAEQQRVLMEFEVESVPLEPVAGVEGRDVSRAPAVAGPLVPAPLFVWKELCQIIWLAGIVTTLAIAAWRIVQFQRLLREAAPVDPELQEWVGDLAMSLGLVRLPSVWWIGGKVSPMVWSLGRRPRLIIPIDLWKGLDQRQRSTLLFHELAHIRRGDHHIRFLELVVTALYWWHPVVWYGRRALRTVEEQCCDAWVVWAFPDATKSYAETLLETLDFLDHSELSEPLLASGFGNIRHLRKRLTMIMNGATPRLLGVWGTLGSLALAVALLPVNATWAQQSDQKQEVRVIVTTDDDAGAADPVVTVVPTATVAARAYVVTDGVTTVRDDDGELGKVELELTTNGQTTKVRADSFDEAIAKLRDQIKSISKKEPVTDQDQQVIKALEGAIRGLEKSGRLDAVKPLKPQYDVAKQVVVRLKDIQNSGGSGSGTKSNPDIEAARRQVEKLTKAVRDQQHQLADAHKKLSELQALAATQRLELAARNLATARTHIVKDALTLSNSAAGGTGSSSSTSTSTSGSSSTSTTASGGGGGSASTSSSIVRTPKTATVRARIVGAPQSGEADQKRIAELEKKLDQLLEEVTRLKKARGQ